MTVWSALAGAARDLVLSQACAGCRLPTQGGSLCPRCAACLVAEPREVWPLDPPRGFPPTTAAASYEGVVRRLIVAHKEQGRLPLAGPLSVLLEAAVLAGRQPGRPDVIVPVPSRRQTTRRRGHDPVARMARAAAQRMGVAVPVLEVLGHSRRVVDQGGLSMQQRRTNVSGALLVTAADPIPAGCAVVLVDDICSTGSTLAAAGSALRTAGVDPAHIRAAVVAAPPLRR